MSSCVIHIDIYILFTFNTVYVIGGGQRRELNVLKRLRISGALLILLWKCDDLAVWTSAEKDERND